MKIRILIIILFLCIIPVPGFSFNLEGVAFSFGDTIIFNGEPVETSSAPGFISFTMGVSVPMRFTDILYFDPGLRVYNTLYALDADYKPVPAAVETWNRISVINFEIRPELGAVFDLSEKASLGVTGAPAFTLRFPVEAFDEAKDSDQPDVVRNYFFSSARFLGFYAGGFFTWRFSDSYALTLKAGTNLPVYHIWDGDDAGFADQLIIEPELGFVFRL